VDGAAEGGGTARGSSIHQPSAQSARRAAQRSHGAYMARIGTELRTGIERQACAFGRAAASMYCVHAPVGFGDHPESVAADTGHVRIDGRQRRRDRNRRLDRIAAVAQNIQPRLRGQVMRCGHHAAIGAYRMAHQSGSAATNLCTTSAELAAASAMKVFI